MPESQRLDELEAALRRLSAEVAELRAELHRTRRAPPDAPPLPAAPVAPTGLPAVARPPMWGPDPGGGATAPERRTAGLPRRQMDLEGLVGRYGALALAAVTILMAAGTFLGWAIAHGRLGPTARVGLGALAALAVAALGWWLRGRGTRVFGNTLLALALAIVHVDAWGAGPLLGLVAPAAALAVAALASALLAALAWREGEQSLFVVGVGGALLAPFVTSRESGPVEVLLAYGLLVIASALAALRGRRWPVAERLLVSGCLAYALVAIDAEMASRTRASRVLPALFALACSWAALLWGGGGGARRATLARAFAVVALVPVAYAALDLRGGLPRDVVLLAALGAATVYLTLRRAADDPLARPAALVLPLAFLAAALAALPDASSVTGALVALGWAAGALAAAWDASDDQARAPHLAVAGVASAVAIPLAVGALATGERRPLAVALLAAHAAGMGALMRRARTKLLAIPAVGALLFATAWAFELLRERPAYGYVPFLTVASLAAAAAVAGWTLFARSASRAELRDAPEYRARERALTGAAGALFAFFWGREELGRAGSPELSTFLLVCYYAGAGVLAIFVGRWRRLAGARQLGLALAIFAALKAMIQASTLGSIGLRVGSYLAAGLFLLAVAYWYRTAGEVEGRVA